MHRLPCLFCCLAVSLPAWAETDAPLFAFSARPVAAVASFPSLYDGAGLPAAADAAQDTAAWSRERRREARERLLSAMGLDRFMPARNFTAFGHDARMSLGLREDGSVTLRMRLKW